MLDEADRMLDMGFIRDIKKIPALLPKKRQNLLFSATFSDGSRPSPTACCTSPASPRSPAATPPPSWSPSRGTCARRRRKRELLAFLIKKHQWFQVLVFTRTKHGANKLAEYLGKHGIPSAAIHGNKSQSARTARWPTSGRQAAGAGRHRHRRPRLDIDQLPQVVNFELPNVPEDYVHRIGRTGAAPPAPPCRWSTARSCRS